MRLYDWQTLLVPCNEGLLVKLVVDGLVQSKIPWLYHLDTFSYVTCFSYVPKNTAIDIPMHTIFRDPKYFSPAPEEFRPERFLSAKDSEKSEAATNMAAFIPFSFGPENCAGRNLAIIELRVITALMVRQFDMKFASGYDQDEWPNSMEDYFVMKVGPLPVVIKSRGFLLEFSWSYRPSAKYGSITCRECAPYTITCNSQVLYFTTCKAWNWMS